MVVADRKSYYVQISARLKGVFCQKVHQFRGTYFMPNLEEKIAKITSAASGIGLAGVETFVERGAKVVVADLQTEKGQALVERFGSDRVKYVNCEVTDLDALKAIIDTAPEVLEAV